MDNMKVTTSDQAMAMIKEYKEKLADKITNGETEESFLTGGKSYTEKEWKKLISHIDKDIDAIKEEQEERQAKMKKEQEQKEAFEKMTSESNLRKKDLTDWTGLL